MSDISTEQIELLQKRIKNIVTHNSRFHADDVFSAALMGKVFPEAQIMRTRDADMIGRADLVFDVGDKYDLETLRFDHHQEGGAGVRATNSIPYAAFGLLWKAFGSYVCSGNARVAEVVDERLVSSLDAYDNGINLATMTRPDVVPYMFFNIVLAYNPTWKEADTESDRLFFELVEFASSLLDREIKRASDFVEAEVYVKQAYDASADKRIIVLDGRYPYFDVLIDKPEVLFVVGPQSQGENWKVEALPISRGTMANRKKMPLAWGGKRDADLAEVTGVSDAIFCHNNRFLIVTGSKESAIALAQKAVEARVEETLTDKPFWDNTEK